MNKILITISVIFVLILFRGCIFKSKNEFENTNRPDVSYKPTQFVENDKIVFIQNENLDDVQKGIQQFCNAYNQEKYIALPRLYVFEKEYAITFPYNIDFKHFCFFVNYMNYSYFMRSEYPLHEIDLIAWCSTNSNDKWTNKDIINKKVMLFVPRWDKEYDNVYLTTNDNIGYKMGFAVGHENKKIDKPAKTYFEKNIDLSKSVKYIDFE